MRPPDIPTWYKVHALAGTSVRVDIRGPIGGDWDGNGVTSIDFIAALAEIDPAALLDVHLSSPGGSAVQGVEIYNNLRARGNVRITVDGMAASAGSIIAMAGNETIMAPGSLMMVHNGRGGLLDGTAEQFRLVADLLDKTNESMAGIYAAKAGGTVEAWMATMAGEKWYTATQAVEGGLADRVDDGAPEADPTELAIAARWGTAVEQWKNAPRHLEVAASAAADWDTAVARLDTGGDPAGFAALFPAPPTWPEGPDTAAVAASIIGGN